MTITQTAAAITIDERRATGTSRVVLALDGAEVTNRIPAGRNSGATAASRSTWKAGRLVTTVVAPAEPGSRESVRYVETRYLDGVHLVVEIETIGSPNRRRTIYARK